MSHYENSTCLLFKELDEPATGRRLSADVHVPNKRTRKPKDSCRNSGMCCGSCLLISGKQTSGHDFATNCCLTRVQNYPFTPLHYCLQFTHMEPQSSTELLLYIQNSTLIFHYLFVLGFLLMASLDLMANSSSSCHPYVAVSRLKKKRREAREVRRKLQKLRWVVPGGRGLQRERLFAKTAHYILHLRLKVCALETILKLQDQASQLVV